MAGLQGSDTSKTYQMHRKDREPLETRFSAYAVNCADPKFPDFRSDGSEAFLCHAEIYSSAYSLVLISQAISCPVKMRSQGMLL